MIMHGVLLLWVIIDRDVTTRRCLTSYERVEEIVRECATIKTDLDRWVLFLFRVALEIVAAPEIFLNMAVMT